jgi:hypothetical protein
MHEDEIYDVLALVVAMRRWQRTFFRTRDYQTLLRAKDYEAKVDARLRAWIDTLPTSQEEEHAITRD